MASYENALAFVEEETDEAVEGTDEYADLTESYIKLLMLYFSDAELPIYLVWLQSPREDRPALDPELEARRVAFTQEVFALIAKPMRALTETLEETEAAMVIHHRRHAH